MDRRKFLSIAATAAGALGIPAAAAAEPNAVPSPAQGGPRYNVLLLMSDQHKRSCMGVSGDAICRHPEPRRARARERALYQRLLQQSRLRTVARLHHDGPVYAQPRDSEDANSIPFSHKHKTIADQFADGRLPHRADRQDALRRRADPRLRLQAGVQ